MSGTPINPSVDGYQSSWRYPSVPRLQIFNDFTSKDYKVQADITVDWKKHGYLGYRVAPITHVKFLNSTGGMIHESNNKTDQIVEENFPSNIIGSIKRFTITTTHDIGKHFVVLATPSQRFRFGPGEYDHEGNFTKDVSMDIILGAQTEVDLFDYSNFRKTKWTITNDRNYVQKYTTGPWDGEVASIKVRKIGEIPDLLQLVPSKAFMTSEEEQKILDERANLTAAQEEKLRQEAEAERLAEQERQEEVRRQLALENEQKEAELEADKERQIRMDAARQAVLDKIMAQQQTDPQQTQIQEESTGVASGPNLARILVSLCIYCMCILLFAVAGYYIYSQRNKGKRK